MSQCKLFEKGLCDALLSMRSVPCRIELETVLKIQSGFMHDFQLCCKSFTQKCFLTYSFFEIIPFGETNFSFSFASSKMSICICNFAIFSTMIFQISPTIRIQFLSIRDIITPDFFDHVTSNIIGVTWCHVTWCHVIQVIFFHPPT